jgi:hypothetical protein
MPRKQAFYDAFTLDEVEGALLDAERTSDGQAVTVEAIRRVINQLRADGPNDA